MVGSDIFGTCICGVCVFMSVRFCTVPVDEDISVLVLVCVHRRASVCASTPVLPNQTQLLVRQPAVVPSKHTDGEKSVSFEKNIQETRRDRDGWCSSIMMRRKFLKIKWLGFGVAARKRTEAENNIHALVKFNVQTI